MKKFRFLLPAAVALLALPACKSNDQPDFGIDEDKPGFFALERRDERADRWHDRRERWAKREDEKWNRIFERSKGNY